VCLSGAGTEALEVIPCTAIAPIPAAVLRADDIGKEVRLFRLVPPHSANHGGVLFIDLRGPLRPSPKWWPTPTPPCFKDAEKLRSEWGGAHRRQGCANVPPAPEKSRPAERAAIESLHQRNRSARARRRAADARVRRAGISGGHPAEIPLFSILRRERLHRKHHDARRCHRFHPAAHEGGKASSNFQTPILTRVLARRARARLSCAVAASFGERKFYALPQAPQQFQAADHDFRLRPVISRSLLASATRMRRRRSLARRILPTRSGKMSFCHPSRTYSTRSEPGDDARACFEEFSGRASRWTQKVSADPLSRGDAPNTAPTSRICATRWSFADCERGIQ